MTKNRAIAGAHIASYKAITRTVGNQPPPPYPTDIDRGSDALRWRRCMKARDSGYVNYGGAQGDRVPGRGGVAGSMECLGVPS